MEMMPIGGFGKMYVKYFVGQSDNQVRVEFIPQVTMIMPNGKHFLEGNVYSMWVCEEELPPTSDREAWESLLGISLMEFPKGEKEVI